MENIKSIDENEKVEMHHWLSPVFQSLTLRHSKIYGRYQGLRILIDFGAAACFVSGSVLFIYPSLGSYAGQLFLIGSILFAVKPTIDLVRAFHLKTLKGESDNR